MSLPLVASDRLRVRRPPDEAGATTIGIIGGVGSFATAATYAGRNCVPHGSPVMEVTAP